MVEDVLMNLPSSFVERIVGLLGQDEADKLLAALQCESPVSIRINGAKWRELPSVAAPLREVAWCSTGCYLAQRPSFTFDPLLHAGCYYVQEAASMFVEQAVRRYVPSDRPIAMLDLCAAPGGKSTHLRSLLSHDSLLVANEIVRSRAQILAENLTKWGHSAVVVTNNDASDFAPFVGCFDAILADVPCSGEGMFRKDAGSIEEWSEANVTLCWQRQRRILTDIWDCLKPGGVLIYSTCTYNTHENEENVRWVSEELGADVLPLPVPSDWNVTGNLMSGEDFPVYRFLPHRTMGEGFFLAVLRKWGNEEGGDEQYRCQEKRVRKNESGKKNAKNASPLLSKKELSALQHWVRVPADYEVLTDGNAAFLFPQRWTAMLAALRSSLHVLQAGTMVGMLKGRDLLPCHDLALCPLLNRDAFPCEELSYRQAIAYLRKEAVILSDAAPRGFVLVAYGGHPLGFVKNVGNRANNLYLQEWRIRSGYVPESAVTVLSSDV